MIISQMSSSIEELVDRGFFALPCVASSEELRVLFDLIGTSVAEFRKFITVKRGEFADRLIAAERSHGQFGTVLDGREGLTSIRELRSHLVYPQPVSVGDERQWLQPYFYAAAEEIPLSLTNLADAVISAVEPFTDMLFKLIEEQFGCKGLADAIAGGERILRYHYYPSLPDGNDVNTNIKLGSSNYTISARRVCGKENMVTWVTPHVDIGHWTWQLYATDSRLTFATEKGPICPFKKDMIIGNACSYLEIDVPEIKAPVHWVDASGVLPKDRISVALFVHVKPDVKLKNGQVAGVRLYEDLYRLGYGSDNDIDQVKALFTVND